MIARDERDSRFAEASSLPRNSCINSVSFHSLIAHDRSLRYHIVDQLNVTVNIRIPSDCQPTRGVILAR
jgi:hypothetical protein